MAKHSPDPRLRPFVPLAHGSAEMSGPDCRVVLHDVGRLPRSVIAIENAPATGRDIGDAPIDLVSRSARAASEGSSDARLCVTASDDKVLKETRRPDGAGGRRTANAGPHRGGRG